MKNLIRILTAGGWIGCMAIASVMSLASGSAATAKDMVFEGTEFSGRPCSLVVHNPDDTQSEQGWTAFHVIASSPWQAEGSPALDAHLSPTMYSLYARSTANADQIALEFAFTPMPSLSGLMSYTFQTKSADHVLFQAHCQNMKPKLN